MDDRPQLACCLSAEDDELATDPDAYDCDTCAVLDQLDGLWPENRAAWTLSRQLLTRFTHDFGCVGLLIERVTRDQDLRDALDLVTRLTMIYDELCPPIAVPKE